MIIGRIPLIVTLLLLGTTTWASGTAAIEVCAGERVYLKAGEGITIHLSQKPGCMVRHISFDKGSVEENIIWPSGRTTRTIRQVPMREFSYPEWPPSVLSYKAITPAIIAFLAQKPVSRPTPSPVLKPARPAVTTAKEIRTPRKASQKPKVPTTAALTTTAPATSGMFAGFLGLFFVLAIVGGLIYMGGKMTKRPSPSIVISHWYTLIENLKASPMEFYAAVEQAIESRQVPNSDRSRVDWKEGGIFSAHREYLRVNRKDFIFDVCGAPFGTGFFVSWWLGEIPSGLIAFLIRSIPVIGRIFERFSPSATYYKIDTALMFQQAIHAAVMEVIDGMTKAKGLRALSESERKPILRDFHQR